MILSFSEQEIAALPKGADDFEVRQARFKAFDKAVFALFDQVIRKEGPLTEKQVAEVQAEVISTLKKIPETLAEMLAYTNEIDLSVTWKNSKHGSGWPWNRKYVHQKYMHMNCIFDPYDGSISAWNDYKDNSKIHHFR